ncbi:translation factor [Metschnikowia bicuspidata var. bicuspidata NRRL YB-4993]|uniref:Threonylcarbamoyl-AMP synthase n=1 Tax=Metschnikowia bicuspidata var. bicuspidata NRRL YB-4993 TaxID=869754 RepID=A0A1A0HBB6_9ASCO|nr:translation factor [Metschnikowia bicuspidata var. bicuspidata NRRL YB-4993]OBA21178.1 translation factor [Metschnikowia bicuspidata var. bicuspidata NRRL YB-4993]
MHTKILAVLKHSISFLNEKPIFNDENTEKDMRMAASAVRQAGKVVAFPTETVYGLGGSALNDQSVKAIYQAKNRPADNPLIVHVSSIEQVQRVILTELHKIPPVYEKLLQRFWPGPLTILVPIEKDCPISELVTTGQKTVGVRMPDHSIARALIALSDTPLAAPSANASTRPSPTLASHVMFDLNGKIPYILDGGACSVGVESTVIDGLCSPPMLLRPGGVSAEDIKKYGGEEWKNLVIAKKSAGKSESVRTPGMKYKHYSPTAKVILFVNCGDGAESVRHFLKKKEGKIAILKSTRFLLAQEMGVSNVIERELGNSATEIAHSLFRELRDVDELGVDYILVEGVEEVGDGLAVMNRLSKAASDIIEGDYKS